MSRRVFSLFFLFLLLLRCACGSAWADDIAPAGPADENTEALDTPRRSVSVKYLSSPFLTGAADSWEDRVVFSLSSTKFLVDKNTVALGGKKVALYFKRLYGANVSGELDYRFLFDNPEGDRQTCRVLDPVLQSATINETGAGGGLIRLLGGGGSGIVVSGETYVIPVTYNYGRGQTFSTIIYSINGERNNKEWVFVSSRIPAGCIHPAVVEWGKGKILMMTSCNDGLRRVYESTDMGDTWTEAVGSLSRVWGNNKERTQVQGSQAGFITAEIDGKSVLLFTQVVESTGDQDKYELRLWATDTRRVIDIGSISTAVGQNALSTLFYAKENVFAVYERHEKKKQSLDIVCLEWHLKRLRKVLRTWAQKDAALLKHCSTPDVRPPSPGMNCTAFLPRNRLVGFLSRSGNSTHWADEYLCVNATVTNAKKVEDGFEFEGSGSGAQWPVGTMGQNQPYHFANYGFTLVATATIHRVPENDDRPLLGVALKVSGDGGVLFGLSYSKEKKWTRITDSGRHAFGDTTWELGRQYQVALVSQEGRTSVYVDWQLLETAGDDSALRTGPGDISHFYFGANAETTQKHTQNADKSRVTVTNVLLYNRPFSHDELEALQRNNVALLKFKRSKDSSMHLSAGGGALLLALGLWGLAALC